MVEELMAAGQELAEFARSRGFEATAVVEDGGQPVAVVRFKRGFAGGQLLMASARMLAGCKARVDAVAARSEEEGF